MSVEVDFQDTHSADTSDIVVPPRVQMEIENMDAKFSEVCSTMCCSRQARDECHEECGVIGSCLFETVCCSCTSDCRHTLLIFFVVVLALACAGGIVFLWAVPYSNIVAALLWPAMFDSYVKSVFEPSIQSGFTTFVGFVAHAFCLDALIVGVLLLVVMFRSERDKPKFGRYYDSFCCPIYKTKSADWIYYIAICLFVVSGVSSSVFFSIFVGKVITTSNFSECTRFRSSSLLFQSWIGDWSCSYFDQSKSQWVLYTGDEREACSNCIRRGVAILLPSIVGFIIVAWIFTLVVVYYRDKYNKTKQVVIAAKKEEALNYSMSIGDSFANNSTSIG